MCAVQYISYSKGKQKTEGKSPILKIPGYNILGLLRMF